MRPARMLIVNAADFGRTEAVNAGVLEAHEDGIVTSASLMVRWPTAQEAAASSGRLSVGLMSTSANGAPSTARGARCTR